MSLLTEAVFGVVLLACLLGPLVVLAIHELERADARSLDGFPRSSPARSVGNGGRCESARPVDSRPPISPRGKDRP